MKRCSSCREEKELEEFHKNKTSPDGYQGNCKPCNIYKANRYRKPQKQNPTEARTRKLMSKYGITDEQYDLMYVAQEGCCAICREHSTTFDRALDIDHEHSIGFIRGLLCHVCNKRLGHYESGRLTKAASLYKETEEYYVNEGVDFNVW